MVKSAFGPRGPIRPALNSGFRGMKRLGVFLLPPGWDASPSQGQKKFTFCTNISNVVEEISSKQCFVTTTR